MYYILIPILVLFSCSKSNSDGEFELLNPNLEFSTKRIESKELNKNSHLGHVLLFKQGNASVCIQLDNLDYEIISETWTYHDLESTDSTYIVNFIERETGGHTAFRIMSCLNDSFDYSGYKVQHFIIQNQSNNWILFDGSIYLNIDGTYVMNIEYRYLTSNSTNL